MSKHEKLKQAAQALCDKLENIHADPQYQSVWTLYAIHGGDYTDGLKYDKELAALKMALKHERSLS